MSHYLLIDENFRQCMLGASALLGGGRGQDSPVNHPLDEFVGEFVMPLIAQCQGALGLYTVIMRRPYHQLLRQCLIQSGFVVDAEGGSVNIPNTVRACIDNLTPKDHPTTVAESEALYSKIVTDCVIPTITCMYSTATEFGVTRAGGQPG